MRRSTIRSRIATQVDGSPSEPSRYLVLVLRTAWVTDDAFITLRTVDNWVNGFGLRWNAGERVQVYTHPLWMLVLSAAYALTHEPFYTTIAVPVLVSTLAVCGLVRFLSRSPLHAVLAVSS